jgi:tetratricopeptide (TPR) repeat protein
VAYLDLKRYEDAFEVVKKGLEINPEHAKSYLVLGQVYDKMNKKEEALAAFEKAVNIDPTYEAAWDRLVYSIIPRRILKKRSKPTRN